MCENFATIIDDKELILYFTNFLTEDSYLVILGGKKFLFTDMRYYEDAVKLKGVECKLNEEISVCEFLKQNGVKTIKMPFKYTSLYFYKILESSGFEILDNSLEISNLTSIKNESEISNIKKSCEICEKSFYDILPFIKEGITENELLAHLEFAFKTNGAEGPSFNGIVAFGSGSSIPHYKTKNVVLKKNMPILMDFGCLYNGYASDMTRTLFFGTPDSEFLKCYNLVKNAHKLAYENIRANMLGKDADKIARDYLTKNSYGEYFTHSLGHGVGVKIHESPNLSKKSDYELKNGNVFSIEPAIYLQGKFGIRIEDTVYLKDDKCVSFMKSDKNLIVI